MGQNEVLLKEKEEEFFDNKNVPVFRLDPGFSEWQVCQRRVASLTEKLERKKFFWTTVLNTLSFAYSFKSVVGKNMVMIGRCRNIR